ncbi:MAG: BAX inhibitor protein [Gammaproteobacteria bacterium RIFCSPHIGHO2_12_FULL_35_23]|nr:MAG: BAX inhibitor protein [Gammaproteobacteria bacterium RIFCSPHIGHO2_12_FULL_35_23]
MQQFGQSRALSQSVLSANRLLMKTYLLLGSTLLFSGIIAFWAMAANVPPLNPIIVIIGYFGLLFLTSALRKSSLGLVAIFALTGFMGLTLGPILDLYLKTYVNGGQLITTALGGTGIIFFVLSFYAIMTKKDFSYLGGFLAVAITGAFLLGIANIFLHMPVLNLLVSGAFILLSSGLILFQTSEIVRGGETSYIMATVTLYVSLFNIFVNLLSILGMFSGRDR